MTEDWIDQATLKAPMDGTFFLAGAPGIEARECRYWTATMLAADGWCETDTAYYWEDDDEQAFFSRWKLID